ncbi:MAG TPA: CAP family protein [Rhizomicrobium sp.]
MLRPFRSPTLPVGKLLRRLTGWLSAAGALAVALAAPDASADVVLHVPCSLDASEIVQLHNTYREALGVPPLHWSEQLAAGAQQWANVLAARNQMVHSHTPNVGENLAMWWGHRPTLNNMMDMWTNEKAFFQPGTFPALASSGEWERVAHYTQMVWRNTTEVGCGMADNGRTEFLVCWYNPQGNFFDQNPF